MRTASVIAMVAVGMAISAVATRTYDRVQEAQYQAEHREEAVVYNGCDIGAQVVVFGANYEEHKMDLFDVCREMYVAPNAFRDGPR